MLFKSFVYALCLVSLERVVANPVDPTVVSGSASFKQASESVSEVTVKSRAIIDWKEFSIGPLEITKFVFPNLQASSSVLNRVTTKISSQILGRLESNGKVYLINPNGIFIGKEAIINTQAFLASTLDVLNEDFLSSAALTFCGDSKAPLVNYGKINAWDGDIFLLGYTVKNSGKITASRGVVGLGAGQEILLKPEGSERLFVHLKPPPEEKEETGVLSEGYIQAIRVELKADGNAYQFAIKHKGNVDALGIKEIDGSIVLFAEKGSSYVDGKLVAKNFSEKGGEIRVLGQEITLADEADLDVRGSFGGGTVLVGGDYKGKNPLIPTASWTRVGSKSRIDASALTEGDGGRVIIWGEKANFFRGTVYAQGGREGGGGGLVEVSSKYGLVPKGFVDVRAPKGKTGMLLWDPVQVTISSASTSAAITPDPPYSTCPVDFDFATLTTAVINAGDLQDALAACNVTIDVSQTSGSGTGSITFNTDVSWGTGDITTTLTLIADSSASDSININADIVNTSTAFSASTNVVNITTPNLHIGLDAGTQTSSSTIQLTTGGCKINNASFPTTIECTGGNGASASSGILCVAGNLTIGDVSSPISGDIILKGGIFDTTPTAQLFTITGNIAITTSGDITLDQYSALPADQQAKAPAQIFTSTNGSITITGTSGSTDILLRGGNGSEASGTPSASIGTLRTGNVTININGDCTLTAGGSPFDSRAFIYGTRIEGTGNVSVTARNFLLTGGSATPLSQQNYAAIQTGENPAAGGPGGDGTLSITASGAISLQGGSASGTEAYFATFGTTAGNSLTVDATGTLTLTAGSASVTQAKINTITSTSPITISSGSLTLTGGTSGALLGTSSSNSRVTLTITGDTTLESNTEEATIFASGAPPSSGDTISITGSGSCTITSNSTASAGVSASLGGRISATFGGSFSMAGTDSIVRVLSGSESLTIKAGTNMTLNQAAQITTVAGDLSLISDNLFPSSPSLGSTSFTKAANVTISSTSGEVRIFTATRRLNTVSGSINGTTFSAGPEFVNSSTEQWGTYFPSTFGGTPFTLFYKYTGSSAVAISAVARNNFLTATAQGLRNWDVHFSYDTLYYVPWSVQDNTQITSKTEYKTPYLKHHNYNTYKIDPL